MVLEKLIMSMGRSRAVILGVIILSFITSVYFYPTMPEKMVSHWNMQGQPDGFITRFLGLILMPIILIGLALFFIAIPRIDPLKTNIEKFKKYYDGFIILLFLFLFSIHLQIILWNIGVEISPNITFPIGFGFLFFYIGVLCENAKRNWFIGIRTPWTLSSDKVWDETHKIGGKLFKIASVIAFIGVFFQSYALYFIIIPVILIGVATMVYSYFEYQKVREL